MTDWQDRTVEQRNLLNPAFCAVVIWHVAKGYATEALVLAAEPALPLELAFVGASLALRGQTRSQLPSSVRSSLATWVQDHPLERSAVAKGVAVLRPYVREALIFGVQHGALTTTGKHVACNEDAAKSMKKYIKETSADARDCVNQSQFIGRWLHKGGTPSTVMALLGVQT